MEFYDNIRFWWQRTGTYSYIPHLERTWYIKISLGHRTNPLGRHVFITILEDLSCGVKTNTMIPSGGFRNFERGGGLRKETNCRHKKKFSHYGS
jgi:hypothetical protein